MKELKIKMSPRLGGKIYNILEDRFVDNAQLKEIILSNIKWQLIQICHPNIESLEKLDNLKNSFQSVKESPNNWTERNNWINEYGIFFKILIPDELYNPKVNLLEMEIEEITEIKTSK